MNPNYYCIHVAYFRTDLIVTLAVSAIAELLVNNTWLWTGLFLRRTGSDRL